MRARNVIISVLADPFGTICFSGGSMNLGTRAVWIAMAILFFAGAASAQQTERRAITFADMVSMRRLTGPQISPDGKWIAYEVATPDVAANKISHDIWLVASVGGE